jgi:eukaryotic-like serine/threonine-protein kinase
LPLALADAQVVMKTTTSPNLLLNAASLMALGGQEQLALKIAQDVSARRPYDTIVQFVNLPVLRAIIDLNHGEPAKAIDELDGAMPYAQANVGVLYLRGIAFLKLGKGDDAAKAFQRIQDLRGLNFMDPGVITVHVQLARAFAAQGDKAQSRVEYQNFFAQWKDADPDVPLLRQAKEEYAKLQ